MPNAVCAFLKDAGVRDLGIHTEMLVDGMIDLWEAGLITPYVIAGRPDPDRPSPRWDELGFIVPRLLGPMPIERMDGWPVGEFPRLESRRRRSAE